MKLWEKKRAAALGLALVLALPGCQKPDGGEGIQKETETSAPLQEVISTDPTHIFEEVKEDFLQTQKLSQEITLKMCQSVPWYIRLGRSVLRIFAPML